MSKYVPIKEIYGEDLRPKYRLENDTMTVEEFFVPLSPEAQKAKLEYEKNIILKREETLNEKPELFKNLQKLDISLINDIPVGWNLFDPPTELELIDLCRSIESVGLINPIHVMIKNGVYFVVCGQFRLDAYIRLYRETKLEKYKCIPCYIINFEETGELFIRNLIFESNFKFKHISKPNMIRTLIENYEIMKKLKNCRNENNIGMILAEQFEISERSVFNFLRVKKLCDPGLTLLYEEKITLKAALYLTKMDKETQKKVIERFGIEGVNTIYKMKILADKETMSIQEIDKKINIVDDMIPFNTNININISVALLEAFIGYLLEFKREFAADFAEKNYNGKFNKVFKVRCNEEDMDVYIEKNRIDEVTLKRLLAKSVQGMAKIR